MARGKHQRGVNAATRIATDERVTALEAELEAEREDRKRVEQNLRERLQHAMNLLSREIDSRAEGMIADAKAEANARIAAAEADQGDRVRRLGRLLLEREVALPGSLWADIADTFGVPMGDLMAGHGNRRARRTHATGAKEALRQ